MATDGLAARLGEPFEPGEVRWKPQSVSGNRAMAIAYVDARVVMDRLDEVFGVGGWQTAYRVAEDGVFCRLRVRAGGEWVEHEDVGSFSEQPDDGDKLKAAVSDSLKRAAVHLGVGRYLYRLPRQWVDYDPQRRQLARTPTLPDWALPRPQARPTRATPEATPEATPADDRTVEQRAGDCEAEFVAKGWCAPGDLFDHLEVALGDLWAQHDEADVRHEIKAFLAQRKQKAGAR